jgi:GLTT repeat (6 copies)
VPNRRRRRLSTATSAVAALAVASPFAYIAISNLSADIKPAPQHREFVRAAEITDLPGELMGALSQGLSQFGVTIPPVPSLTGVTSPSGLAAPGLTSPGLTGPGIGSPGLTSPGLTSPGLTSPGLTTPGLTPGLTDPSLTSPGLTSPGLTSPGLTPTGPTGFGPAGAGGLSNPSELPISDPIGLDPGAGGTYPILGDPSLGGAPSGGSGGLVGDMMSAANQLGAGQAIDLLKGMIMPGLMNAAHGAAAPAAPPPLPAPH